MRCAATLVAPDGLPKASETGEVLFRDYGVSGIAAFNLSRFVEPGDTLDVYKRQVSALAVFFAGGQRKRVRP